MPPLSGAGEAEDDEDVASDAGFTPGFTPPTAVHWLGCGYAGSLCPKREDFDPLALGMYAGPRLPPWALLAAQVALLDEILETLISAHMSLPKRERVSPLSVIIRDEVARDGALSLGVPADQSFSRTHLP